MAVKTLKFHKDTFSKMARNVGYMQWEKRWRKPVIIIQKDFCDCGRCIVVKRNRDPLIEGPGFYCPV
jgi:hypothetical protein